MEPVAQLKPNLDGIVIGWSSSKMVSGSCALPPRWLPQCSCVVIESSFDPGERLQAPGSLWLFGHFFLLFFFCHTRDRLFGLVSNVFMMTISLLLILKTFNY